MSIELTSGKYVYGPHGHTALLTAMAADDIFESSASQSFSTVN